MPFRSIFLPSSSRRDDEAARNYVIKYLQYLQIISSGILQNFQVARHPIFFFQVLLRKFFSLSSLSVLPHLQISEEKHERFIPCNRWNSVLTITIRIKKWTRLLGAAHPSDRRDVFSLRLHRHWRSCVLSPCQIAVQWTGLEEWYSPYWRHCMQRDLLLLSVRGC